MDRQLVDPREKSSVCSTMSSILNHVSVIDLQSLVTIIAILYYTKMEKKRKKKNFFFIQHLSKDNFHMLTFTKGHFKAWLTPLLPPPPSDEDEAAGSSSFSCIAISFVAVVSSPLLSLYVLQLFSCFSSPYSLIGSIWDQFLHLLLMIRSGQPYPGYLWLPVAVL